MKYVFIKYAFYHFVLLIEAALTLLVHLWNIQQNKPHKHFQSINEFLFKSLDTL